MRKFLLYITFCILLYSCGNSQEDYKNYEIPLIKLVDSLALQEDNISVLIDKSDYKLSILSNNTIIKEYPIVLGGNSTDDKRMEGDQCTPEGTFSMVSKYPHQSWTKFIWIDYPTEDSWKKYNNAIQDGEIPADAKIGGEIGMHGVPAGMDQYIDLQYNWTLGCISLKNKDINEIFPYIKEQTKIEIRK